VHRIADESWDEEEGGKGGRNRRRREGRKGFKKHSEMF